MSDKRELDDILRERFATLRATDAPVAPEFGAMFATARHESQQMASTVDQSLVTSIHGVSPITRAQHRWRRIALFTAGPLLTAAGLAGVWFNAEHRADREFDHVVMAWTQTAHQALRSPTDGLLSLPGDEYLRSVPAVGRDIRNTRSGS